MYSIGSARLAAARATGGRACDESFAPAPDGCCAALPRSPSTPSSAAHAFASARAADPQRFGHGPRPRLELKRELAAVVHVDREHDGAGLVASAIVRNYCRERGYRRQSRRRLRGRFFGFFSASLAPHRRDDAPRIVRSLTTARRIRTAPRSSRTMRRPRANRAARRSVRCSRWRKVWVRTMQSYCKPVVHRTREHLTVRSSRFGSMFATKSVEPGRRRAGCRQSSSSAKCAGGILRVLSRRRAQQRGDAGALGDGWRLDGRAEHAVRAATGLSRGTTRSM